MDALLSFPSLVFLCQVREGIQHALAANRPQLLAAAAASMDDQTDGAAQSALQIMPKKKEGNGKKQNDKTPNGKPLAVGTVDQQRSVPTASTQADQNSQTEDTTTSWAIKERIFI